MIQDPFRDEYIGWLDWAIEYFNKHDVLNTVAILKGIKGYILYLENTADYYTTAYDCSVECEVRNTIALEMACKILRQIPYKEHDSKGYLLKSYYLGKEAWKERLLLEAEAEMEDRKNGIHHENERSR